MAVITISRQYGTGADDIAAKVCELLGYRYFDKGVMSRMATEFGLTPENVIDFSEEQYQMRGFLDRLRGPRVVAQVRTWREDLSGRRVAAVEEMDEEQAILVVRRTIGAAYEQDNIVIVGRGGQAILGDRPGVLHVRVQGPVEARSATIQDQKGVSRQAAEKEITERDRRAKDYVKNFYNIDSSDPVHYHLVINTGRWDSDAAARLIVNALSLLPPVMAD
jgi:cytidylate kinase